MAAAWTLDPGLEEVLQSDVPINPKVKSFEAFLENKLRPDLRRLLKLRDGVYDEISEYERLGITLTTIAQAPREDGRLKTQVDLGCNFFCQAVVPDASMVCVAVGFGFFLEMTHDETHAFIKKKTALLTTKADALTERIAKVKAHMSVVAEGVRELERISVPEAPGGADTFFS